MLDGHYVVTPDHRVHFEVPDYDKSRRLVIDPVLVYSTYLGGSGDDYAGCIAVDSLGNVYVAGATSSTDFPALNAKQATNGGSSDVFVSKFNAAGTALVYSTYLGGSGSDSGAGIALDPSGNAYVTGFTNSTDFPTLNPFQSANAGGQEDAFVTELSADGSALVYSTYLGGSGYDFGGGIAVDSSGNAFVTGGTDSTDFPTQNPFQPANAGFADAFVAELSGDGSALVYSTYLGGGASNSVSGAIDGANGIALDSSGNAYVTGITYSTDFPTQNPFQPAMGGEEDAFVVKLNAAGSLVYSTYLGGSNNDFGIGIAVDSSGDAYVTGGTTSPNFPTTNSLSKSLAGVFVAKFNPAGSALIYSTLLGGTSGEDIGYGVAVDSSGHAFVTGYTYSPDFPLLNALQATYGGSGDAFVARLNASGSALVYSTYLGGGSDDNDIAIAVDSSGNAYVAGATGSEDFPPRTRFKPRATLARLDATPLYEARSP